MSVKIQVWDLPLRLFHWLLVVAVLAGYISGELGGALTDWHGRIGAAVLGLLVFRLTWGLVGSAHARFHNFFPTPARLAAYVNGSWQGHGHNPLGALSVIALLGVLALLVATGLFANDDIAFQGPLYGLVDKSVSDRLSGLHHLAFNLLLALAGLHVAAIAFYWRVKQTNLVIPMITGEKTVPKPQELPVEGISPWRFVIALALALLVVWAIFGGALPQHLAAATPAASTATW